jgi:hypothetical protein
MKPSRHAIRIGLAGFMAACLWCAGSARANPPSGEGPAVNDNFTKDVIVRLPAPGEETKQAPGASRTAQPTQEKQTAAPPRPVPAPSPVPNDVEVMVEATSSPHHRTAPSEMRILAPFAPKLPAALPAGWRLVRDPGAPDFRKEVSLPSGGSITLRIKPLVLVPDADGITSFAIQEPGSAPGPGGKQPEPIASILARSNAGLQRDAAELSATLDSLRRLLVSLPNIAPSTPPAPAGIPETPPR